MKSFRSFINEEVLPTVQVPDGSLDISKSAVRAAINAAIAGVVSQPAVTPYVVYNRLSKLLAQYHIILPKRFLEGDKGVEVFEVKQFGHKMGMTDSGEFVNEVPATHYLFLQYGIITPMGVTYAKPLVGGMFRVTARLVDKEELDRLLDMAEITMSEEAECMQMSAKAMAPKEPMHDITSDEKKKGNKEAVADSEKGLDEEALDEKAPPGAKFERMVKHIKKGYAKGGLTDVEKAKAYGAAWKAYGKKKMEEDYRETPAEKAEKKEMSKIAKYAIAKGADIKKLPPSKKKKMEEDYVQIDEVSKETLASYIPKAAHSVGLMTAKRIHKGFQHPEYEKDLAKHAKRMRGISTAAEKLAKEETLDELSRETLQSYRKKVADKYLPRHDAKARKHTHGHTTAGKKLGMDPMDATIDTIEKTFTPRYMKNLGDRQTKARESDPGFKDFKSRKRD